MSRTFDAASGLPLNQAGRRAMNDALDRGWADPTRLHHDARVARQLSDAAQASVADSLHVLPQEVTFVASGTAAIQVAILGLARGRKRLGDRVVASAVEHSSLLRAGEWVDPEISLVPVDSHAQVEVDAFFREVSAGGVALAALQWANHEVGTLQALDPILAHCRNAGVPLVVDACAGLGALDPPTAFDVLIGSAHKWGGPAGVGVLVIRTGVRWRSPYPTDEAGRLAGFPNIPAVVAAAAALEESTAEISKIQTRRARLSSRLRVELPQVAPDILVLGPDEHRLPHLTCFTVLYAEGETLVTELDRAGFAVSSGSACTADTRRPSHVLAAMGAITHGNLRISLGPEVTDSDVDEFLAALPRAVAAARGAGELAAGPF